ncbi:Poly-gamma-glutamate biosynthesis protein PgsC/CapC [Sulfidibacter corallicola]|uniref:Poly-gamma-glutamate biosynthesis protein PgsC/CapC n=1 Tax=Sulfidibacter corallicola TaxID=2818388 RepID=A0A8A4TZ20_SULCO|nr:poly-gamma-glutamate biosynthesis protein PgsC/CapC [Sulfidibacter corallicola]QTD51765.1 poly-gamma-glutamate biosynthesis protein PgsC/CapC [Sulfidibacter corallicola]
MFPLFLFPPASLAESVITTVWVGALVVIFFNQTFGWSLSGLVVPGYLVPLLILKPVSVAVILVEGVTAYALVRLMFAVPERVGWWHVVFGRDRFFALVLSSIFTRLAFDTWLLPQCASWLAARWQIPLELGSQLHSFGLIIVALIANQFWKPGLARGLVSLGTCLWITFLLVRFVLLPFTNFTLGNVAYLYEDLAAGIMGTPKAYMILVTTALIASRMNQRFGWEFNGILLPALLALQWYQPGKIVLSFVEAMFLVVCARLLFATPLFRHLSIEGGRKILVFFNLSFLYKYLLSFAVAYWMPELKATDAFGFGYMLSTLLAIKMYEKSAVIRISRATLQTAFYGTLLANLIGFGLVMVQPVAEPVVEQTTSVEREQTPGSLLEALYAEKPHLYQAAASAGRFGLQVGDGTAFARYLATLDEANGKDDRATLTELYHRAEHFGLRARRLEDRYLLLAPMQTEWRSFVLILDAQGTRDLMVQVPKAVAEPETVEAGLELLTATGARFLAIHADLTKKRDPVIECALNSPVDALSGGSPQMFEEKPIIRVMFKKREMGLAQMDPSADRHVLVVQDRLHRSILPVTIERRFGELSLIWGRPRDGCPPLNAGSAHLLVSRARVSQWSERSRRRHRAPAEIKRVSSGLAEFLTRRLERRATVKPRRSGTLKVEEMLFYDRELVTPLMTGLVFGSAEVGDVAASERLAGPAAGIGYRVTLVEEPDGHAYWVFHPKSDKRIGCTFVVRQSGGRGAHLQVPRPFGETGTFGFGLTQFQQLEAGTLLIGDDRAGPGGNVLDPTRMENRRCAFNLFHQVLLRESRAPLDLVQVRTRKERFTGEPQVDLWWDGSSVVGARAGGEAPLLATLRTEGYRLGRVDGLPETTGLEIHNLYQARYLNQARGASMWVLWLTAKVRQSYRAMPNLELESARMAQLAVPQETRDLSIWQPRWSSRNPEPALIRRVRHYQLTRDLLTLGALRDGGHVIRFLRDRGTRQGYLAIYDEEDRPMLLANLNLDHGNDETGFVSETAFRDLVHRRTSRMIGRRP